MLQGCLKAALKGLAEAAEADFIARVDESHEAVLGINKFWTLGTSRRRGYAKKLLDQARQSFIPSYVIPRVHIAWTFTTDDGAHFAKEYLQSQTDYDNLTYDDQM